MKNKIYPSSKFSEKITEQLIECFSFEKSVKETALDTGISENTVSKTFNLIREKIYSHYKEILGFAYSEIESIESDEIPKDFFKGEALPDLYEATLKHSLIEFSDMINNSEKITKYCEKDFITQIQQ